MKAFERLVQLGKPCDQEESCLNSPRYVGEERARCRICRLAPERVHLTGSPHCWQPTTYGLKHPLLLKEKREEASRKQKARYAEIRHKGKAGGWRRQVQQSARLAERSTQEELVKATRNSGRTHQDGDHILDQRILLDTKLQSKRVRPVVDLGELEKIRKQARIHQKLAGGLVLRNQHGACVVAMDARDFVRVLNTHGIGMGYLDSRAQ